MRRRAFLHPLLLFLISRVYTVTLYEIVHLLYNATLVPITLLSVLFVFLVWVHWRVSRTHPTPEIVPLEGDDVPWITVQIPTYNDPVALRCLEHCLAFDYPRDRYEIIVADDSSNPEVAALMRDACAEHSARVRYLHRTHREGFKPGALQEAMAHTRGEIVVLFDADWMPEPDFLRCVARPFVEDETIAIVQTRQGYYNGDTNIITRFSVYLLMAYHWIIMPIHHAANSVFFCGTAGALRRTALEAAGGWNAQSITEDADLTVKILSRGYRSVYLPKETPSEVPETLHGFVRQQMRWCSGNVRVFFEHARSLLFPSALKLPQRLMITYVTMGFATAPIVILMTIFGVLGWLVGPGAEVDPLEPLWFVGRFVCTGGFLVVGAATLHRARAWNQIGWLLLSFFTVGLVLAAANTVAFTKALFNLQLHWFCTPKRDNAEFISHSQEA